MYFVVGIHFADTDGYGGRLASGEIGEQLAVRTGIIDKYYSLFIFIGLFEHTFSG